jgi:hypothetical protein
MALAFVLGKSLIDAAAELLGAPPTHGDPLGLPFIWEAVPIGSTPLVLGLGPGRPSVAFTCVERDVIHISHRDADGTQIAFHLNEA